MDQSNALSLRGGGLVGKVTWPLPSDWLIRDEFTDTVAAGSVNGTAATPGPGTRAQVDASSVVFVGSGNLSKTSGGTTNGQVFELSTDIGRSAGMGVFFKFTFSGGRIETGIHRTNPAEGVRQGFQISATWEVKSKLASASPVVYQLASGNNVNAALVLRSVGQFHLIKNASGDWVLAWVGGTETNAENYIAASFIDAGTVASIDFARGIALPAPFDTDDGLATDTHSGSVAAGTTFSHEADCLIEFTVTTLGVGDGTRVWIRSQDSNNYFYVYIDGGTGNFGLYEVVSGGTPVQRANLNSAVATGHRVVIIADGTTIKGYSNNTLSWTYSSATNFATATSGKLATIATGGAVSDLKTWPRTLSGTAASILNKVSA